MNIEGTEVTIPEENCADMGGEQVYAVIPESTVEVADSSLDSSGNLFDSTDARFTFDTPFLLRCNESELFSNCVLKTEAHSFHPSLSMKDSHISMEEGYMDFSDYTNLHNIQTAYSLLMQISGIQGKVVQSTNHTVEINGKSCYTFETEDGSESYAVTDNEVYVQEDHGWKQVTE